MKNIFLVFLTMVLVSGCATHDFTKWNYTKDQNYKWQGGILHYGEGPKYDDNKVENLIHNFCEERNFKKISLEKNVEFDYLFLIPIFVKTAKLEFECINDSKK